MNINGLVAHYIFDGNADDQSGFGRHATVYGAVLTVDRFANANRCYSFSGVSNYIAASPINDVVNDFTETVWFYAETTNTFGAGAYMFTNMVIYPSHGQTTWGDGGAGVGLSAGMDRVRVFEHTHDYAPIVLEHVGSFLGWTHAAIVYSNQVPSLFINGVHVATGSQSPSPPACWNCFSLC